MSDARRLKAIKEQNSKLKRLLAKSMLDAMTTHTGSPARYRRATPSPGT